MGKSLGASKVRTVARHAWGDVQSVKQIVPGVWGVDTAGHGGYVVMVGPNEPFQLNPALRDSRFIEMWWEQFGTNVLTGYVFEEDCAYAVLLLAHPELIEASERKGYTAPGYTVERARETAQLYFPGVVGALDAG